MIKNDLFLRALKGETVERPPVWMMRQAGRYLPEFQEIKAKYDFFTRCQTPELASEITVQPIRRYGMDAAILFSDILVIPQAMNIHVEMKPGIGPWLPDPIRSHKDLERVIVPDINDTLGYVMDAIKMTKEKLNDEIPLIGFAGVRGRSCVIVCKVKVQKTLISQKNFALLNPKLHTHCFRKSQTPQFYI